MMTKSGQLHLTKTDRKCLQEMLAHVRADLSFKEGGSFVDLDNDKFDGKAAKRAVEGIRIVEWILEHADFSRRESDMAVEKRNKANVALLKVLNVK